ncbi:MAG: hypothetical protein KC591_00045, partial [Gemmatimonadetes bacterium]|nr:hypothetical protein [Gemmatimonadota bacterium]
IADDATDKSDTGEEIPLQWETVQALLDRYSVRDAAGRYRLLTSRFLPGRPVGGWSYRGTRDDDPNDTIPHQDRRSLRALRVFGAWLNHVDLKVDNSLDLYTEENGRRFLRHYLVDFDGCLGGYKAARHEPRIGFAYDVDLKEVVTGLPTFGLLVRPYEDLPRGKSPLVGQFGSQAYDPAKWKANYLNDILFACRPADAYWAGRQMTRLGPEHVRAAVTAARYGDPAADAILAQVLVDRWEKTVDWALRQVTPAQSLERITPRAGGFRIEATDALVDAHRPSDLEYRVEIRGADGRSVVASSSTAPGDPAFDVPASATDGRDYLVVRWIAETGDGRALPPTDAHYLRAADGWKLVGILRDGE